MMVEFTELENSAMLRLDVVDPRHADVRRGQAVGYLCPECRQADETRDQVWHEPDCSHVGEHGRTHYDDLEPTADVRPSPELKPEHRIDVIVAAEPRQHLGIGIGTVLGFRCTCGNLDESVFEVVHDAGCDLADESADPFTDIKDVPVSPRVK